MRAYVTLLSTMSYLPGVIVLHESLKQVGASYSLWVGVSRTIPHHVDDELKKRGMCVIRLPASIKIPGALKEQSGHWGDTFDKLHLFGLTGFVKLVYLDSDMMVLVNIDELFDKPHMSAVAAGSLVFPAWTRLNSGLMVIEPEHQLPEKIAGTLQQAMKETSSLGNAALGDQDLINAYYPDWPDTKELHLDDGYNLFYSHMDAYIGSHGYQLTSDKCEGSRTIRVVHFVGKNKPWMKWAVFRHFFKTCSKRNATKWQRQIFMIYTLFLKKIQSQKAF